MDKMDNKNITIKLEHMVQTGAKEEEANPEIRSVLDLLNINYGCQIKLFDLTLVDEISRSVCIEIFIYIN